MRKRTTTKQLNTAIINGLLQVTKAEVYYKTSRKTESIDADKFKDGFDFLCESGVFADVLGWHYERDRRTGNYEIETGRMNPDSDIIVTVYLDTNDGVDVEDIEKALLFEEE